MANYNTEFSFAIKVATEAEKEFLLHWADEPSDVLEPGFDERYREWEDYRQGVETHDDGDLIVWITGGEGGEPVNAAAMLADWQIKFSNDTFCSFEFAHTCSRPRLDSFGGGGVLVHKGNVFWAPDAHSWISNKIKELEKQCGKSD